MSEHRGNKARDTVKTLVKGTEAKGLQGDGDRCGCTCKNQTKLNTKKEMASGKNKSSVSPLSWLCC